jgi:unsaturated rhamnogalacturonyl hydrolase
MKSMKFKLVSIVLVSFCVTTAFAQKKIMIDNFYNNEISSKTGKPFHYIWEDKALSGFSELGDLFQAQGATLATLKVKPTKATLKSADVFIIVDPDTKLESAQPNFMDKKAADAISNWVKKGGILLMLTNDGKNSELENFNILAAKFGMKFNNVLLHPEIKAEPGMPRNYNSCASINLPNHSLFQGVNKIFLKEVSSISCQSPAKAVLEENGQVLIAEAKFGKGYVFAVGDPWLYNEYIDHAHLTTDFENLKAAKNLVQLILSFKK